MNRTSRYLNLIRNARFGFGMPRGAALNYMKASWGSLQPEVQTPPASFPLIFASITRRCNLSCDFCLWGGTPQNWKDYEMSVPQMEELLATDAFRKSLLVMMYGGEPLLNKDILKLIEITRRDDHLVGLNTNGLLFADAAKDLVKAGLCDVQMSIYDNTFDRLSNTLPAVTHLLPIAIMYVLTSHRLKELESTDFKEMLDIISFCKQSGCASIRIALIWETDNPGTSGETVTDSELYTRLIRTCEKQFPDAVFEGYLNSHTLPSSKFTVFFQSPLASEAPKRECRRPWLTAVFDAQGQYYPCCAATTPSPVGSVISCGSNAVVNDSSIIAMREGLLDESKPLAPLCSGCPLLDDSYL